MDLQKLKIWQSGLTDEERAAIAQQETVEAKFKKEKAKVSSTVNTKGFKLILDKIVGDIEISKSKLMRCSEKELARLQLEIKVRKEFLDKWTPYM
jgi:hypothetical protein